MTDEIEIKRSRAKPVVVDAAPAYDDAPVLFRNIGARNLYTEKGRVKPNGTVRLMPQDAQKYPGLKIVPE